MAITARAEGTWTAYTADGTVAVPAAQVTGDMMVLLASWKDYSLTASVAGWTEITEFADGAVSKGANVGSMKVGAWYKVATSDTEADPTLAWVTMGANDIGGAVIVVFQKAASEEWGVPAFATAAMTNWTTTSQVVTAGSNPGITAGDLVIGLIGIRDDTAAMTRGATTGIDATGITWTGNYVEYPATHLSTTTGFDMAVDAGYRIASSGTASAAPTMEGTLSAAETGAALWIRFRVATATTANAEVAVAAVAASVNAGKTGAVAGGLGAATATAYDATAVPGANAGLAAATATGYDATVDAVGGAVEWGAWSTTWSNPVADSTNAAAGLATAAATALDPAVTIAPVATGATADAAALAPTASVAPAAAAGIGTATGLDPATAVATGPAAGAAIATAIDPTISTAVATNAPAELAAAMATAGAPAASVATGPTAASATASAINPTVNTTTVVNVDAGLATATATGADTGKTVAPAAGQAAAIAAAWGAYPAADPGSASASASAYQPTIVAQPSAIAGLATAVAAAWGATGSLAGDKIVNAGLATATATAWNQPTFEGGQSPSGLGVGAPPGGAATASVPGLLATDSRPGAIVSHSKPSGIASST